MLGVPDEKVQEEATLEELGAEQVKGSESRPSIFKNIHNYDRLPRLHLRT